MFKIAVKISSHQLGEEFTILANSRSAPLRSGLRVPRRFLADRLTRKSVQKYYKYRHDFAKTIEGLLDNDYQRGAGSRSSQVQKYSRPKVLTWVLTIPKIGVISKEERQRNHLPGRQKTLLSYIIYVFPNYLCPHHFLFS